MKDYRDFLKSEKYNKDSKNVDFRKIKNQKRKRSKRK